MDSLLLAQHLSNGQVGTTSSKKRTVREDAIIIGNCRGMLRTLCINVRSREIVVVMPIRREVDGQ